MANKNIFVGMLVMVLTFSFVVAGCATATVPGKSMDSGKSTASGKLNLEESIRRYMGPRPENRDIDGKKDTVYLYYLDPFRFEDFKAELDAGGEYVESGSWTNDNRDWEREKIFLRGVELPDGSFNLELCKLDNSVVGYNYKKVPEASRLKLDESLRNYMAPQVGTFDGYKVTLIYYLDLLRVEDFRAELEAEGYVETRRQTNDNHGDSSYRGMNLARWVVLDNGSYGSFSLDLYKADNSRVGYSYKKLGAQWNDRTAEGDPLIFTYLGLENPGAEFNGKSRDLYASKGYYIVYYHKEKRKRYVYFPTTGVDYQYSEWLD